MPLAFLVSWRLIPSADCRTRPKGDRKGRPYCKGYTVEQRCFALDNLEHLFAEFQQPSDQYALHAATHFAV